MTTKYGNNEAPCGLFLDRRVGRETNNQLCVALLCLSEGYDDQGYVRSYLCCVACTQQAIITCVCTQLAMSCSYSCMYSAMCMYSASYVV